MLRNINSFVLSNNIIKKMKDKIGESKKKRLELGFNLCTKGETKELQDASHCIGTACEIEIKRTCEGKGNYVGKYHTHPTTSSSPSIQDLAIAYKEGIICVGGSTDNKIKCYVRKEKIIFKPTLEFIQTTRDVYERPIRKTKEDNRKKMLLKEMVHARKFILDNHFHTIDII